MWPFNRKTKQAPRRPLRAGRVLSSIGNMSLGSNDETFSEEKRSTEEIIASELKEARGKMRTLEEANDYAVRWLGTLGENVIGGNGVRFQSAVMRSNGDFNKPVNDKIEAAWKRQQSAKNYTTAGEHSGMDSTATDKLILRSVARDGFLFIRIIEGFENETGFSIQLFNGDILDHELCLPKWRGNRIANGVELDQWNRVVAYHVLATGGERGATHKHLRLGADDIIFPFVRDKCDQHVGMPWAKTVLKTFHGLDQYEESVLMASREGAIKAAFYEQDPINPIGDVTEADLGGEIQPGEKELLPPGVKFVPYDPSQPTDTYDSYRKGVLMRAATGLEMSYQSLSGDLSGGNFASQRVGLLDEREVWKGRQSWFCSAVKAQIFKRWLRWVRVHGLDVPDGLSLDQLYQPIFRGRRWTWVDPQKDLTAAKIAVEEGFTSREKVIADSDSDTDEEGVLRAIKRGQDLEESIGVELGEKEQAQFLEENQQPKDNEQEKAFQVI